MTVDVSDLRDFYGSPLGQVTARLITNRIQTLWPDLHQQRLLGVGYALPYLEPYLTKTERVLAFMPAQQGVLPWPTEERSLTALTYEATLPLPNQSIDRILLVHSIEHAHNISAYLRELWRVMTDNGRIIVVAPNRRSLWAQLDFTPFGQGQPYTMTQLRNLLKANMFMPIHETRGLYLMPSSSRLLLASNNILESLGDRVLRKFSGVICIEAMKQVYMNPPVHHARHHRRTIAQLAKI
ncbi:MAG: methyltransferase domain-containing protein [Alphaproteobacteria bacterium]